MQKFDLKFLILSLTFSVSLFLSGNVHAESNPATPSPTSLKVLEALHGHLGPYVIIGGKMGDFAIEKLEIEKYTGVRVIVECEPKPPMSCMVDGLQATTGATYGKQNIFLLASPYLRVRIINTRNKRGLTFRLTTIMERQLKQWNKDNFDVEKQGALLTLMKYPDIFNYEEFVDK